MSFKLLCFFAILTSLLPGGETWAQSLYKPRDVTYAFKNQTRSDDGKPGKNYWQNRGAYDIKIDAAPVQHLIKGAEQITYFNNSPDTLSRLVFKVFMNIHKPGAPHDGDQFPDYLTSGVHFDSVAINGNATNEFRYEDYYTIKGFRLKKPLMPHDSIKLAIKWHYQLSKQSGREGMIDSSTCFLAYFYPRLAVYDDYNFWDVTPFLDSKEFYSDFNDYRVSLTVPENYIVWGTGTLQRPETLLQPAAMRRFAESMHSDEVIHIATKADLLAKTITAQRHSNTWVFTARNVPDMTFCISDHFNWDASSVMVDSSIKRRASVQAAYNDTARDYHSMVSFGRHSLNWFSNNWPGVPYPYEKSTVVQGYADMEYPMMVNDGTTSNINFSQFVVEHEIAHTYMPFYMGINETRYGSMDEGWATTFEFLIGTADNGLKNAIDNYKGFRVERWIKDRNAGQEIPIITPGTSLTGPGLGSNEYVKPSLGYLAMKDMLGDALFKKCLQAYMSRWNGKHPIPWDFFNTFNNVSGQNLNWFWSNWFFGNGYIDLALNLKKSAKGYDCQVKNKGGFIAPFDLLLKYADGKTKTIHETAEVWKNDQKDAHIFIPTAGKIVSVKLDGGIFMDADESDNNWPRLIN